MASFFLCKTLLFSTGVYGDERKYIAKMPHTIHKKTQ